MFLLRRASRRPVFQKSALARPDHQPCKLPMVQTCRLLPTLRPLLPPHPRNELAKVVHLLHPLSNLNAPLINLSPVSNSGRSILLPLRHRKLPILRMQAHNIQTRLLLGYHFRHLFPSKHYKPKLGNHIRNPFRQHFRRLLGLVPKYSPLLLVSMAVVTKHQSVPPKHFQSHAVSGNIDHQLTQQVPPHHGRELLV